MTHFKPILCRKCGSAVWAGISWAGFPKRLGVEKLTIEEEIIKRINNLMTYEIHRTQVSFEAVERTIHRIKWADPSKKKIILADHHCSDFQLFQSLDSVPDYWPAPSSVKTTGEGFPF